MIKVLRLLENGTAQGGQAALDTCSFLPDTLLYTIWACIYHLSMLYTILGWWILSERIIS